MPVAAGQGVAPAGLVGASPPPFAPEAVLLGVDPARRDGPALPVHGWLGESGAWIPHTVFPLALAPTAYGPGNYILARRRADGRHEPLYIGETSDLPARLAAHERWEAALALGMTHVHVHHLARGRRERLAVEADLRRRFRTPLNDHLDPAAALARAAGH